MRALLVIANAIIFLATDWKNEQMSWKQTCYVEDWSFLRELVVKGPEALKPFSDRSVNSFITFDIGQAKHVIL